MSTGNRPTKEEPESTSDRANAANDRLPFPIAGIGASAGGLEAVSQLLRNLPADTGMTFVVVSHLDPAHESALTEILGKVSVMPVSEVRDGDIIAPNHVFVIPPNHNMVVAGGKLRLTRRGNARTPHLPIDQFLRSLAEEQQGRSMAVILSGTGSDGTLGVKAIKAAGGITFAQDETAAHSGMPQSAVSSGCIDAVLPPAEIAAEMVRIAGDPDLNRLETVLPEKPPDETNEFSEILRLLSQATGVEFQHYKRPTLTRRVQRRMALRRLQTFKEYLDCIREDPEELRSLYEEVLIHVTAFFRDPDSFESLKELVFPLLVENRQADSPIRIWVPGCSTGEEVYSIAICVLEFLGEIRSGIPVKIFGTDVSEGAIDRARSGTYAENISADVSEQRLRRFFVKSDGGFQINKAVREMCVFARQDVARDPPFSNLDIVTCRNLLIYLDSFLQSRVMPVLHYALKLTGFLMLGTSETTGEFGDLFEVMDKKQRIYRKRPASSRLEFDYSGRDQLPTLGTIATGTSEEPMRLQSVQQEADRVVLERYAPAGVVIDDDLRIVQYRGHTGQYLEAAPGTPNNELLQMAREGLLTDLKATIDQARQDGVAASRQGIRVRTNGDVTTITVEVIPLSVLPMKQRFFIVLFSPSGTTAGSATSFQGTRVDSISTDKQPELIRVTEELATTRSYLQSVVEAKEATNEELKAANEEIISSNEELQSTNEELETAKEELQATNEELNTVNDELQNRIAVANVLGDDLKNLIDSTNIPTVVLGHDLHIRRFTPSAKRLFNLVPSDIGRHISDFKLKIDVPALEPLILQVLDTLAVQESEVVDEQGCWHRMSVRPYRTHDNRIDGVIITLQDIETLKQKERELTIERDYRTSIVETLRQPLLVLDQDLRVRTANQAFLNTFQVTREQTENRSIYTLSDGGWNTPALRSLLEDILPANSEFTDFEVEPDFPNIGHRALLLNARQIRQLPNQPSASILLAIEDITDRRSAELALQSSMAYIESIVENSADSIVTIDEQGDVRSFNPAAEQIFGYRSEEVAGQSLRILMRDARGDQFESFIDANGMLIGGDRELVGQRKDGTTFPMVLAVSEFHDDGRRIFTGVARDMSAIRAAQERALQAERLAAIGEAMTGLTHESRNALQRSQSCLEMLKKRVEGNEEATNLIARLQAAQDDLHQQYEEVREYAAPIARRTEPTDIGRVLLDSWNDTMAADPQWTAHLRKPESPPNLTCEVNPHAMRQVFRNLLQNSFVACADPVEVTVRYAVTNLDDRPALTISLTDNGPGLTPDQRQHVFEPFYTTKTKGTGLGMAIVHRIVTAHGGHVEVGRPSDSGTEILITLPREQSRDRLAENHHRR